MTETLSGKDARLIALASQGFGRSRPVSAGETEIEKITRTLGLIQLDSVNVVVRSHYMPYFSRLGPYDRSLVEKLAFEKRRMFEYWAHVASLIPIESYPLLRWRMRRAEPRWGTQTLLAEAPEYFDGVLEEVRERGPLIASDLDDPGTRDGRGGWWNRSAGKIALEWHFRTGAVTTHSRPHFTRYYDLAERVIPRQILALDGYSEEQSKKELLVISARAHGIGTARDLADYFRLAIPEARRLLASLVAEGRVLEATVEGWSQPAYLDPNARVPRDLEATALLSPFDSLIWERERTQRIFGFHYRVELYVPEKERRYGYYVMPFLMHGQLVARVDLKADRQGSALLARAAFLEPGRLESQVAAALAGELRMMAGWLELDRVVVGRRGNLAGALRRALRDGTG